MGGRAWVCLDTMNGDMGREHVSPLLFLCVCKCEFFGKEIAVFLVLASFQGWLSVHTIGIAALRDITRG